MTSHEHAPDPSASAQAPKSYSLIPKHEGVFSVHENTSQSSAGLSPSHTLGIPLGTFFQKLQFEARGDNEARLHMLQQLELNQTVDFSCNRKKKLQKLKTLG